MNWDTSQITECAQNMKLKRFDNYETYFGQLKLVDGWEERHGFGEYKESDDCITGICYSGQNDFLLTLLLSYPKPCQLAFMEVSSLIQNQSASN